VARAYNMRSPGQGSLARNSVLNFGTQVFSVVVAFASLPFIVHGLGDERFGLLTLLWLFVGYFSVIDFGAGQAALRFLSVAVAERDVTRVARTFRLTFLISACIGLISAVTAVAVSYTNVTSLLRLDETLRADVGSGLRLLAFGLPAQLLQVSLKSFPMAFNRYGLNAALQATSVLLQWVGGAIVATAGGGFMGVLTLTVVSRYLVAFGYIAVALSLAPEVIRGGRRISREELRPFLSYGGWAAVPQLLGPAFAFIERFVVGAILPLAWVTYFAIPSDTVGRFLIFPLSFVYAAFPVFSGGWTTEAGKERVKSVYARSVKLVMLGIVPLALVLGIFAGEILTVWLGPSIAEKSTVPLMILACGMVFNVLAQIPVTFLMAVGRPDLPAKLGLVQTPLYIGALVLLTGQWGIVGTAAAWAIRVTVETAVLVWLTDVVMGTRGSGSRQWIVPAACATALSAVLFTVVRNSAASLPVMCAGAVAVLCVYVGAVWWLAMDGDEHRLVERSLFPWSGAHSHDA
jgi:O-antigen/teichoic acid export membrane protein